MLATANYLFYDSYKKAHDQTNIALSTLKQRVKYLKRDYPDQYDKLKKMNKMELKEEIIIYSKDDAKY